MPSSAAEEPRDRAAPPDEVGPAVVVPAEEVVDVARTPGAAAVAADEAVREVLREHTEAVVRAETAREGIRRLSRIADDEASDAGVPVERRRPPMRLTYPRWGWRDAVRFAVERRMYTPEYLRLYQRYLRHALRAELTGGHVVLQGIVFTGKRVEFHARRGHGRLLVGPWCWIGNDNKLRAHEGQLTLGAKVVMGRDNVINAYLDIEVGETSILADWIYICDFDHRFERLDVPIKDQGIVKSPVRIGDDVWVGVKATVLRGAQVGDGCVLAAHTVVRGDAPIPERSVVAGVPGRVVRDRRTARRVLAAVSADGGRLARDR